MNPNENGKVPYETYTDVSNANIDKTADRKHNLRVSLNAARNRTCMSILTLKTKALHYYETLTVCHVSRHNIPGEFRNFGHSDSS
jgi:hypothetical protein